MKLLREVFKLLRNAELKLKLKNCKFMKKEIKFLGVKITEDWIKIDSKKSEAITSVYSPPPSLRIVSSCRHF